MRCDGGAGRRRRVCLIEGVRGWWQRADMQERRPASSNGSFQRCRTWPSRSIAMRRMRRSANHLTSATTEGHGQAGQGWSTQYEQRSTGRASSGCRHVLYYRAGVQARSALHRGGKEHCSTAHQSSNGLPTMGNVWLGLRRPFCASLGAHCTDAVSLQKCLTLASMGRTEERSCLCACRACNTCLAVHMAGDAARLCSANGGRCEGPGIASQRTIEPEKATTLLLVAVRIPASGLE